jgi:hypothetical protein
MRTVSRLPFAVLAAAAALLIAGCGEKSEPSLDDIPPTTESTLSVVVEPTAVAPGGRVEASVLNETDAAFTYGADYALERQGPGGFQPVKLPERPVIQKALIAQPGEQGPAVQVDVPAQAQPGTWRVVIQRNLPDVGDLAGEFEVRGG